MFQGFKNFLLLGNAKTSCAIFSTVYQPFINARQTHGDFAKLANLPSEPNLISKLHSASFPPIPQRKGFLMSVWLPAPGPVPAERCAARGPGCQAAQRAPHRRSPGPAPARTPRRPEAGSRRPAGMIQGTYPLPGATRRLSGGRKAVPRYQPHAAPEPKRAGADPAPGPAAALAPPAGAARPGASRLDALSAQVPGAPCGVSSVLQPGRSRRFVCLFLAQIALPPRGGRLHPLLLAFLQSLPVTNIGAVVLRR